MPTKKILIAGGAGYIGSHMVACAKRAGYVPMVLDDLSTGHRDALLDAELVVGDINDAGLLAQLFATYHFDAVMHFASFIQVGESVRDPAKYYRNNVSNTLTLLQAMMDADVKNFIFSSSAAVYGEPQYTPIDEKHPITPINPYGRSKWMIEQVLQDYALSYGLKYAALRYFNAAGADPESDLAERHDPETHLIPLVLQVASGYRKSITVYGDDYATADGSCIRDYIHVNDICEAHLLALEALWNGGQSGAYNLGTGQGFSVLEVIDMAREVSGQEIIVLNGERRAGDPAVLVADASLAKLELGWQPKFSDLKTIIQHAWQNEKRVVHLPFSVTPHSL